MPGGVNPTHIRILTVSHARFALRSGGGVVFVVLALITGMTIASFALDPLDQLEKRYREDVAGGHAVDREQFIEMMVNGLRPHVSSWVGGNPASPDSEAFTDHLLKDRPALLSGVLVLMLIVVPFLTCAGSFNQVSGDIGNRGLRYLLLRTERTNILLARWLGTALFVLAALFVVALFASIYISFKFSFYGFGPLLEWGLRGFLAMALLALPYICLGTLLNTVTDSPIASLVLALLIASTTAIAPNVIPGADLLPWLSRLTPWGWKYDLLRPDAGPVLMAAAVCVGWSALLVSLAVWRFRGRDL